MTPDIKKVLIVGAGFGGLSAALVLEKQKPENLKIILVSDKPHFEYTPALYRVVTGRSPLEVCIPVREIVRGRNIEFSIDKIVGVDVGQKIAKGSSGSRYQFDYLILALGSEASYFGIPGLEQFSLGFKSIPEALKLKRHLHRLFEDCVNPVGKPDEKICLLHLVVVGAGASGVELAGELAVYTKKLASQHKVDPALITIDLVEAAPRILPMFAEAVSARVADRLRHLGVNIYVNRPMVKEDIEGIQVQGMSMKTKTVIWTAGVKPNSFYQEAKIFEYDQKGRVIVDEYLQAKGLKNIFVTGDGASTKYSGLAQTAISDGKLVAQNIIRMLGSRPLIRQQERKPYYVVPAGPGWAVAILGRVTIYGAVGWFVRRAADFRYFLSILSLGKALTVFRNGRTLCEACSICLPQYNGDGFGKKI